MGLDMYLYAKQYFSGSEYSKEEERKQYAVIRTAINADGFPEGGFPAVVVSTQVAYWRKDNAIHDWFVQNCQGGEDDCRNAYVSREQLMELAKVCREVLADHALADELLPTSSGFFFGSTDYDEWYYRGLEYTAQTIDEILARVPQEWDFEYHSSW